jgi:hypothetical protein
MGVARIFLLLIAIIVAYAVFRARTGG